MTANSEKVIAILLYPGLTLLDMIGPYSVLSNLGKGYRTVVVGEKVEPMSNDYGPGITPHLSIDDVLEPPFGRLDWSMVNEDTISKIESFCSKFERTAC